MGTLFLIPGLGADCRIYKNIDLDDYQVVHVEWIDPDKSDTLSSYAQKLIDKYHITPQSIVIGNSLGGMIAIEMAKRVELSKVILISSIKTVQEAPLSFKLNRYLPLHRIIPSKLITSLKSIIKLAFGRMSETNQELFISMLQNTSPVFIKWAKNAIIHWDNETIPKNVYHITGDMDKIFPYKRIKGATIIKGGTHIMIFNQAKEINTWLKEIL
ncbi:MAG: alpha/beta hydrolase, partial [Mucilaginibacter sp.]|nr:alpha/beta hydrolase [Mucilaginibacter sp.]